MAWKIKPTNQTMPFASFAIQFQRTPHQGDPVAIELDGRGHALFC